jgi:hypothetical protein
VKKLTTLAFALAILAITFVACGGSEMEEPPPAQTSEPAAAAPADPAAGGAEAEGEAPAEGEEAAPEAAPKAQ